MLGANIHRIKQTKAIDRYFMINDIRIRSLILPEITILSSAPCGIPTKKSPSPKNKICTTLKTSFDLNFKKRRINVKANKDRG